MKKIILVLILLLTFTLIGLTDVERQSPDGVTLTELLGVYTDVDDDPDNPDGNWLIASGNNVNTAAQASFPTPTDILIEGADLQEFRVLVRQYDEGQSETPEARIELWEDGLLIRAGDDTNVTQGGVVLSFTWDADEIGTADGSLVECNVVGTKTGGSPTKRNTVEVGAIEWNVKYGANPSWLSGWDYRIELEIADYAGDIGAEVVWFPAKVFLTASQCEEVFVELTTDAEYLKVAFTKADGTTELYGQKELFDVSEEKGIFHVSRDGWTINDDTSVFLYYDADHADNTTYIGAITARTEVWDGNTEGHWDMAQDPDGDGANAIKDGTSNTRHLTPVGSMTTADLVDAKIGKGIDFDGSDDYLTKSAASIGLANTWTVEGWFKTDDASSRDILALIDGNNNVIHFSIDANSKIYGQFKDSSGNYIKAAYGDTVIGTVNYYHVVMTWDGTNVVIYLDGVAEGLSYDVNTTGTMTSTNRTINIGEHAVTGIVADGIYDEFSISSVTRSAAWIKGLYNSGNDALFTYGSEEEAPITVNAIFFGTNF